MAEYMVFIWDDEQAWEHASPERVQATMAAHREFIARNAPAVRGGSRLHPGAASTSIRPGPDGPVTVSDAAFAATKDVIGRYYLTEAAEFDGALVVAGPGPSPSGCVIARPG